MENTRYALRRLASNAPEEISITKEQYDSLLASRNCLTELASLEEKFFAISESYREVERTVFDITINEMLYRNAPSEMNANGALFGRQVALFMSMARLYVNTIETHTREITEGKFDEAAVKTVLSAQYDSSFYYRVMEAIRNHAQHHAFPVHSGFLGGGWDNGRTEHRYRAKFFFEVAGVKNDKKFKKSTREEIEDSGGKVELKACVRQYFSDFCEIHAAFRKMFSESKAVADRNVKNWRERWLEASGCQSLTALGAFKLKGKDIDHDSAHAFIDPQVDEYREWLEAKTAELSNMACRRIDLYNE